MLYSSQAPEGEAKEKAKLIFTFKLHRKKSLSRQIYYSSSCEFVSLLSQFNVVLLMSLTLVDLLQITCSEHRPPEITITNTR